ncbi:unnamed protein product [Urochloa humidicola]
MYYSVAYPQPILLPRQTLPFDFDLLTSSHAQRRRRRRTRTAPPLISFSPLPRPASSRALSSLTAPNLSGLPCHLRDLVISETPGAPPLAAARAPPRGRPRLRAFYPAPRRRPLPSVCGILSLLGSHRRPSPAAPCHRPQLSSPRRRRRPPPTAPCGRPQPAAHRHRPQLAARRPSTSSVHWATGCCIGHAHRYQILAARQLFNHHTGTSKAPSSPVWMNPARKFRAAELTQNSKVPETCTSRHCVFVSMIMVSSVQIERHFDFTPDM